MATAEVLYAKWKPQLEQGYCLPALDYWDDEFAQCDHSVWLEYLKDYALMRARLFKLEFTDEQAVKLARIASEIPSYFISSVGLIDFTLGGLRQAVPQ